MPVASILVGTINGLAHPHHLTILADGIEMGQHIICRVKSWNFNSKPGMNLKFANSMFQASLFKMSFKKIILIYFFVISTLSTQTLIRSQIGLGFHCFYLENTWNYLSEEKWESCICFNTFQDFYN